VWLMVGLNVGLYVLSGIIQKVNPSPLKVRIHIWYGHDRDGLWAWGLLAGCLRHIDLNAVK